MVSKQLLCLGILIPNWHKDWIIMMVAHIQGQKTVEVNFCCE